MEMGPDSPDLGSNGGKKGCWRPHHTLTLMGFLGFASIYAMRVNLSLAIVSMVNHDATPHVFQANNEEVCPAPSIDPNSTFKNNKNGEFKWDEYQQGIILGSFYWGYIITQIPGGLLSEMVSSRKLLSYGILSSSVLTLLTPFLTRTSDMLLICSRVVMGLGEGITFPATHSILAEAPLSKRSRMAAYIFTGAQFGSVITLPLTGLLCQYGFDGGWPTTFYVLGSLGVIWFIFWTYLITDPPRNFVQTYMKESKLSVPWKSMATSGPVWAVGAANIGYSWGFYTLMTELPTYFDNILHFNIKQNSLLSALPYLAMWLFSILCSTVANWFVVNKIYNETAVRKIFNSIGQYGPAIALIGAGYIGCNTTFAVILITLAVGLSGACFSGFQVNFVEIAPRYAGTLFGITNSLANISGFVAPYVVGVLLQGQQTVGQWRLIFLIAAAVYAVSNTIFLFFGSSDVQPWARTKHQTEDNGTNMHVIQHD